MKSIWTGLLVLLCMGMAALPLRAQSETEAQALFQKVMGSTLQNDYAGLMSVCDAKMKAMVTADMLTTLNATWGKRFRGGYTPIFMGSLKKQDARVDYWKLAMKDGGDDVLATLVVRQGQVSAFNLK